MGKKRKQAMSPAEAQIGNVVGIDPHKRSLSAAVLDHRGGLLGCRHFPVSAKGHQALETWVLSLGPVLRWGIEGASGLGRHTALYLLTRDQDVRDVCPNRTAERARNRRQGKSDTLDAERIAREVLAHPNLPLAFKRSQQSAGPDGGVAWPVAPGQVLATKEPPAPTERGRESAPRAARSNPRPSARRQARRAPLASLRNPDR